MKMSIIEESPDIKERKRVLLAQRLRKAKTTPSGPQPRPEGSLDWMRTLPVPRIAFLLADLAIWTALALPGLVVGVIVANARFDVDLAPQWWLVPGAVLVALTAACIGYAIATLLAPALAQILSQVLAFSIMLFSPVSFPADRLPPGL